MENGQSLDVADTAGIENAAELTLMAFCWWRADIPQEVCEAYWRHKRKISGIHVALRT